MIEIERKFLLKDNWKDYPFIVDKTNRIHQGYLTKNENGSVRIRTELIGCDMKCYLMSKTKIDDKMSNFETTDEISPKTAEILMNCFCPKIIKKTRAIVFENGKKWEVDFFDSGLILAEVELNHVDEEIKLPEWIGQEITGQSQYYNANM
jgi:CYTH domain-containing protein